MHLIIKPASDYGALHQLVTWFVGVLPRFKGAVPCVLLTNSYKMARLDLERCSAPKYITPPA